MFLHVHANYIKTICCLFCEGQCYKVVLQTIGQVEKSWILLGFLFFFEGENLVTSANSNSSCSQWEAPVVWTWQRSMDESMTPINVYNIDDDGTHRIQLRGLQILHNPPKIKIIIEKYVEIKSWASTNTTQGKNVGNYVIHHKFSFLNKLTLKVTRRTCKEDLLRMNTPQLYERHDLT